MSVPYRGFAITPRTYQIRGTGRWTLDLSIEGRGGRRSFSGEPTFATEAAAISGCAALGRRIIDGELKDCSVQDLR